MKYSLGQVYGRMKTSISTLLLSLPLSGNGISHVRIPEHSVIHYGNRYWNRHAYYLLYKCFNYLIYREKLGAIRFLIGQSKMFPFTITFHLCQYKEIFYKEKIYGQLYNKLICKELLKVNVS